MLTNIKLTQTQFNSPTKEQAARQFRSNEKSPLKEADQVTAVKPSQGPSNLEKEDSFAFRLTYIPEEAENDSSKLAQLDAIEQQLAQFQSFMKHQQQRLPEKLAGATT